MLGKSRYDAFGSGKGGVYVRRLSEAQTWLATGEPKGGVEFKDWASTTAYEGDSGKIAKLTLEHPGEEPVVIEKGEAKDQKFKLAKMPEGKKLKQGVTIDQIAQAFSSIEMEDVRRIEATPVGDNVSMLKLETDGGVVTTFRLRKEGDTAWLSFQAMFQGTGGGEGDAKKKAEEITAKGAGWEFKIPQWKAEQIGKRRADLFETS